MRRRNAAFGRLQLRQKRLCARGSGGEMRRGYCGVLCLITPAVCRIAPNRTAGGMLRFCSAVGRNRLSAFSYAVRLSDFVGSLQACAFFVGDLDGNTAGIRLCEMKHGIGGRASFVMAR